MPNSTQIPFPLNRFFGVQVETVFSNVDTEKRHRVHERSSAENEKSPASVNLQGFSVRLTISLSPRCLHGNGGFLLRGDVLRRRIPLRHVEPRLQRSILE
ncbi:hypothetical protein EMIT0P294_70267 [Pseudomonas sp. IT-P294]